VERDREKRQVLLHRIQQLMHERTMHAPIYEPATAHGVGQRVAESAVGWKQLLYFTAPYEEIRLKK
jgi:peptide/nickel transport system substrate-binding protein